MRVLVLEDDPDMREALAETLRDEGYEVHTASRGSEAIALAGQHSFDLIVSDIRMEGMSGLDAIEAVQQQQPDVGSMVVSGWASEAETLRAVQLNVGAYLKKPFSMDDFLDAVKTTAKRRLPATSDLSDWSLDLVTQALDDAALLAPRGSLSRARRLAQSWAQELGYETGQLAVAGKLALFFALQDLPGFSPPEGPEWLRGWPGTDEPLQWVARASWEASRHATDGELPGSSTLLESVSSPNGPEVWAAYEHAGRRWQQGDATLPPSPLGKGLLSLGQTLLEAGDAVSARQAFLQVVNAEAPLSQQAQAALLLGRLDYEQGQLKAAVDWAQQCYTLAARLGPLSAASLALEAALIRHRAGAPTARAQLEQVAGWAARLGLRGHQAVCAVVLAAAGLESARQWLDQAWESLADETYWQEARLAARWLMPELLDLGALNFCVQHPAALAAFVRSHPEAHQRVRQTGHPLPAQVLQALGAPPGSAAAEVVHEQLRLTCFGGFEVVRGDAKVPEAAWKTQKNKLLLAYLLSQTGQAIHEDHVLEEFWPDDVVRGKRNLYSGLSLIRRALRPESGADETVLRLQDRLSFNWQLPHWYDVALFENSTQRGLAATGDDALFHLRRAAQLYRAPYLEGCFADWALRRRDELEQQAHQVFLKLCQQLCQRCMYAEALEQAQRFLQLAPHLQEAHLYNVRAHLGLSQPEAVLKQFAHCERMLRQEYGIEPNTELLEVVLRARHGLPDVAEIA